MRIGSVNESGRVGAEFSESLVEDENSEEIDRGLEEDLRSFLSLAAELVDVEVLSPDSVAWAEGVEGTAARVVESMGALAEEIRRGVAVLAQRPGEEAFVEALRKQAATADARRGDAEDLAAATRRLREKDLRRLAAQEQLVDPGVMVILRCVPEEIDSSLDEDCLVPTPEEVASVADLESEVVWIEEKMASLAGRLRRGAEVFAARPGEEALVCALQRQAANADAVRAMAQAFKATVARYRAAAGSAAAGTMGRARM
ncbi:hypothetical protein QOZ80_2BG0171770 [Eleusine coracana subsp. coracana]|nr:hypothetical protein QOZ80_2BG0171770 [Eleusine coracana subsp. coracana]